MSAPLLVSGPLDIANACCDILSHGKDVEDVQSLRPADDTIDDELLEFDIGNETGKGVSWEKNDNPDFVLGAIVVERSLVLCASAMWSLVSLLSGAPFRADVPDSRFSRLL